MIRKILLTFFIISNSVFSIESGSIESLDELRCRFKIEEDVLISAEGKNYLPYPFESKVHSDFAYALKDLKQANLIYQVYKRHILPTTENDLEKECFIRAFLEVCFLFGNPENSPQEALFASLNDQGEEGRVWINKYSLALKNFVNEANQAIYPKIEPDGKIFTVVVITTTCSGGNFSIANALTEHLSSRKDIKVIQIDTEDIAKTIDPVMIATGTHTYENIYSKIFQKTNDFSVIPGRKELNKEIHRYIPSNFLSVLKQKMIKLKPDLIISTRSYTSEDIAMSTLGVPFRMMNVDFELCSSLNSYYRKVPTSSVGFWLQNCDPSMFKPLFEAYGCLNSYNPEDSFKVMMKKISKFLHVSAKDFERQFEVIGYPASSEFYPIEDPNALKDLKIKWNVKENDIPIFIVMGKHSTAASKEIFNHLLHAEHQFPLKYLFICGKNEELKKELENSLLKEDFSIASKFQIFGLLSPNEMNEVMNISPMGISKAGASSVIEVMTTKGYVLLMSSYPWEKINGAHLVEKGYAMNYDPIKPLIKQIEKGLKNSRKKAYFSLKNWKENLDNQIDRFYYKKRDPLNESNRNIQLQRNKHSETL